MKVRQLSEIVNGRVVGDGETQIERINDLDHAREGEIAYVDNEKFFESADASRAACLIVPFDTEARFNGRTVIAHQS